MEIISSGKTYGLGTPAVQDLSTQTITFSDGQSDGTTVKEVLEVLISKVQLENRTKGSNTMSLLHLKMALEHLEQGN